MNRTRMRRILATAATSALLTLPASAALAAPPSHANANDRATAAQADDSGSEDEGAEPGAQGRGDEQRPDHAGPATDGGDSSDADDQDATTRTISEDEDGDASNDPDHEFEESLHPSGKDRTDHQDNPQGNAQSDPDDDGVGMDRDGTGEDKPGQGGGVYTDDQDGNNGCGNDQDFEDDNNGLCGGPERPDEGDEEPVEEEPVEEEPVEEEPVDEEPVEEEPIEEEPVEEEPVDDTDVDSEVEVTEPEAPAVVEVERPEETVDQPETAVLGVSVERPVPAAPAAPAQDVAVLSAAEGDSLPRTGASAVALGMAGLATLGTGAAMTRRGRR